MNKEQLLKELNAETYVMIRPSPIEGIGVFAVRDIPKGCRNMFSKPTGNPDEYIRLTKEEVALLPHSSVALIENYCLYDAAAYYVPAEGFKKMDLVNFINHSDFPNIISINEGEYFEAIKDIKAGEELLVDYGELVEEE